MSKRRPKKRVQPEPVPTLEESVFNAINKIRMKMQLQKLHWQKDFAVFAENYAKNLDFCTFDLQADFVVLSQFCFTDFFFGQPVDEMIETWLLDSSKRPVLLGPGNYGIVTIVDDPEIQDEGTQIIVVYIASVYK